MPRARQLAAIMFTDIKGYTALMQQDEAKAIEARNKHRQIFKTATQKYRGKILQYYGDGTLSIFDSAIDAVKCGIEMQLGFQKAPSIPVRIGIHTGDIIYSEEEIIGDSVNVASRIESLAVPGSVFISDKVYDEIKNQDSIQAVFLKSVIFKNIQKPIEVYAIANEGLYIPKPESLVGKTEKAAKPEEKEQAQGPPPAIDPKNRILATKLFIPPPRPQFIQRPRLIDQLNKGIQGKLSLISASAGFGKTTLISEWISHTDRPTAWLSLESADQEPSRFLRYFVAALQKIFPQIGEQVLALFQFPPLPPVESILTSLLNEIASIPEYFLFVLDDYHVIDNKVIDEALGFLLDHLPPQMHLVITTREDPQLPLPRLRVRGQLTELRAQDLRFTHEEASAFLNQMMGLHLTAEDIASLESQTEGWIAGLQMAALSLQGRSDSSRFIQDFKGSHRFVLDYLVEEVIQQQPASIRNFLLKCSILGKLCGPLCNAVTEQQDGHKMLENLERGNLFIVSLDEQRHWYRFHHLFADVLRAHSSEVSDISIAELHIKASNWYEANGFRDDAIVHAFQAKDYEQAATLLELEWPAMDGSFQSQRWREWAQQLPDAMIYCRPVLAVSFAWSYLNEGKMEAGEKFLKIAEQSFEPVSHAQHEAPKLLPGNHIADEEQFRFLPSSIATAYTYILQAMGDFSRSISYARRALDTLPEKEYLRRGPSAALLGLAHWANGELEEAYAAISNAMDNFKRIGSLTFAISGTFGMADIKMGQGKLRDAIRIYENALALVERNPEAKIRGIADLYLGLGKLACEQGALTLARRHLQKSTELGVPEALPDWPYRIALTEAKIAEALGNSEKALSFLDQAKQHYHRSPLPNLRPVDALKAQIWVRQGRLSDAQSWLKQAKLSLHDELSYLTEFQHLTLVRVHIALCKSERNPDKLQKEIHLLHELLSKAQKDKRLASVIEILIMQALTYQGQDNIELALDALENALILAEPQGYVRIFLDEGEDIIHLLGGLTNHGQVKTYAEKLLSLAKNTEGTPTQTLVEPLSTRELEVLSLIAGGHSNKEISAQLFLSLSTIKGHNQHIFEKLGVKRRTEAVARARELGII